MRGRRGRKKVYPEERRRWLERYEAGQGSIPQLAKETGRNIRTIKKQLQLAMEEREKALARTELYRKGLIEHNDTLLRVLRQVRDSLRIPLDERLSPLATWGRSPGFSYESLSIQFQEGEAQVSLVGREEDDMRLLELAREHLSGEKGLWRELDRWTEKVADYARSCYQLGKQMGERVAQETGLQPVPMVGTEEGFHEGYITWLVRRALEKARGTDRIRDGELLKTRGSQMDYGDTTIATSPSPEKLEQAREVFLKLLEEMKHHREVMHILRVRKELEEALPGLKRQLGDILLLGVVPGRCSVCRKLGF